MNDISSKQNSIPTGQIPQKNQTDTAAMGFERFEKTIHEDSVFTVLRCHLLAEYYMDKLIVAAIPRGDIIIHCDHPMISFAEKLVILESLDILSKNKIDSLKKLNTLRNNCSHEQEYEISERDIDKIGFPFGKDYLILKNKKQKRKDLLDKTLMKLIASIDGEISRYIESKK